MVNSSTAIMCTLKSQLPKYLNTSEENDVE